MSVRIPLIAGVVMLSALCGLVLTARQTVVVAGPEQVVGSSGKLKFEMRGATPRRWSWAALPSLMTAITNKDKPHSYVELRLGDTIVVTYAEALAVSLEKKPGGKL